jgi:hypothetical protein
LAQNEGPCVTRSGTPVTLLPRFGSPLHDDGRSNPIPLGFAFPMAGVAQTLTHVTIDANGEVYFTDGSLPIGTAEFGINSRSEMRGVSSAGPASPRAVAYGGDLMMGAGGAWALTMDNTVPGQFKVCWHDMSNYGVQPTGSFDFTTTIYDNGEIEFTYGVLFAFPTTARYVGVSIGNGVGSATEPASDLSAGADSGALGLLFQNTWPPFDLEGRSLVFSPNGQGGFRTWFRCLPGRHESFGTACYAYDEPRQAVYAAFYDAASSAAALQGRALAFSPSGKGYTLAWTNTPFVAPTAAASRVLVYDDTEASVYPSIPFPHVDGPVPVLSVCSNGFISMAAEPSGNELGAWGGAHHLIQQVVPSFRSNADYDANYGFVWREEVLIGGQPTLIVTWDNVERFDIVTNPETFQFQLNLQTGVVTIVWQQMTTVGLHDIVVGYAPGGPNLNPGPLDFFTALPVTSAPDIRQRPLTVTADLPPVLYGQGQPVTYSITNIPELQPGSGIYAAALFMSLVAAPDSIDLAVLGAPGCFVNLGSLDFQIPIAMQFGSPTASVTIDYGGIALLPDQRLCFQAAALFDPSFPLPNGQNSFGLLTSNGLRSVMGSY